MPGENENSDKNNLLSIEKISTSNYEFASKLFDFEEILQFIQKFGKEQYGINFKIHQEDHEIIYKLLIYFFRDNEQCIKHQIDIKKGILLSGPVGCGKTTLMSMMRHILPPGQQHIMLSTRKVAFEFGEQGYSIIQKYSTRAFNFSDKWIPKTYCFDDLGIESEIKHFGNKCNIMAEILLSRYDLFVSHKMITHITTNLAASEIEKLYGNRIRSRMRQMFNLLAFNKSTNDKRC